jgi:hypothetical protein
MVGVVWEGVMSLLRPWTTLAFLNIPICAITLPGTMRLLVGVVEMGVMGLILSILICATTTLPGARIRRRESQLRMPAMAREWVDLSMIVGVMVAMAREWADLSMIVGVMVVMAREWADLLMIVGVMVRIGINHLWRERSSQEVLVWII